MVTLQEKATEVDKLEAEVAHLRKQTNDAGSVPPTVSIPATNSSAPRALTVQSTPAEHQPNQTYPIHSSGDSRKFNVVLFGVSRTAEWSV